MLRFLLFGWAWPGRSHQNNGRGAPPPHRPPCVHCGEDGKTKMDMKTVMALRPTADDSASIAAAIQNAEQAEKQARAKATDLEAARAKALLTASDAEIERLERDAALSLRGADRVAAMLPELREQHAAAVLRELREAAEAETIAYNATVAAFMKKWEKDFPHAVESLRGLLTECQKMGERRHFPARERAAAAGVKDLSVVRALPAMKLKIGTLYYRGVAYEIPGVKDFCFAPGGFE